MSLADVDQNAKIDASNTGNWVDYRQDNVYEGSTGLMVMPVATRVSAHKVIRLHGGFAIRRVKWHAGRAACPPLIPKAMDTIADTLLTHNVNVRLPSPNDEANGYDWQVNGEYIFVQNQMRVPGEHPLPAGQYPMMRDPQTTTATTLARPYFDQYFSDLNTYNDPLNETFINPNANLIETLAENVKPVDGDVVWPFTALPSVLTSNHMITG